MTQEDKELLLRDLSARLPYGVILSVTLKDKYDDIVNRNIKLTEHNLGYITKASNWQEYKPYLRPMSSMTEEEEQMRIIYERDIMSQGFGAVRIYMSRYIEWLDSKHFDWRTDGNGKTLIDKGLALEAPEGMYDLKNK